MPRGSSSSAQPSSPAHGGPTQFSPWGERCRGVAASDRSEGRLRPSCGALYEPPVVSAACLHPRSSCVCWGHHHHHHGLASCLRNHLHHLYLGRRPPVHHSRHQYHHRRQLLASFEACPRRSLLHHPRSSWLLWPRRPVQCLPLQRCLRPVNFGHWNLLSVLFLEVGDKLPHLVSAPTSFGKGLLQGTSKPVINKERCEGLGRGHMSRAGRQSQMYLLLHTFWCCSSLRRLGFFIRRILHHHLPVCWLPWRRILLWILLSSSHG